MAQPPSAATMEFQGVRRMRPDDHFMVQTETDATPMHVGSLTLLAVPDADPPRFYDEIRRHLASRRPATPLLAELRPSPAGYDSDGWVDVAEADLDHHIERISDRLDAKALPEDRSRRSMV